jgi:hypothetical protein
MESKKINQLATEMTPTGSDLTIIGDPITGVSRKITLLQLSATIGTGADLQGVTDNGATTTNSIAIGGLTITGLATGALLSTSGVISSVPYGAANGVATLGGDGKVPSNQLPSYVDDVVEVANFAALPAIGETGKIYITLDNNKVYRWTGSIYVEIAADAAVWGAITGTLSNQTDLQNALNLKANDNAVVHLAGTETITGSKTFSVTTIQDAGIVLKDGVYPTPQTGYVGFASNGVGITIVRRSGGTSYNNNFQFPLASNDYNFPNVTGVMAMLEGTQTFTGAKTFGSNVSINIAGQASLSIISSAGNSSEILSYVSGVLKSTISTSATEFKLISAIDNILKFQSSTNFRASLIFSNSADYSYTFPAASGTLALTSDIPSVSGTATYIPVFTGANSLGNSQIWNNAGIIGMGTNYSSPAFSVVASSGDTLTQGKLAINTTSFSGTSVLQVNGAATITGGLTGTSASFTTSGGSDTFAINHSSGSGIALNITKGGNGEGLYINKTSGSGNAATIIGTLNATTLVKSGGTSSQYLMADGSTSTLTNPVTGTGTTNYLPKFTGASTIGNSAITDDGTTVTLISRALSGTSATFTSSSAIPLRLSYSSADYDGMHFIDTRPSSSSGTWRIGAGTGGVGFGIYSNSLGATPFFLSNATGAATFSTSVVVGSSGGNTILDIQGSGGVPALKLTNGGGSQYIYGGVGGSSNIVFAPSDVESMRITSGGNVGIGTSTIVSKLNILGDADYSNIYLARSTSSNTAQRIAILGRNYAGSGSYGLIGAADVSGSNIDILIGLDGTVGPNNIVFRTANTYGGNTTEKMRITSGGNVGIGTSSPATILHTYKSNSSSVIGKISDAQLLLDSGDYGLSTYKSQIAFGYFTGSFSYAPAAIGFIPTTGSASGYGDLTFSTRNVTTDTAPTERMRITSAGVVLISNLAGTGSRAVLADSSGNLSAPISDISVKENIKPIGYGLNEILQMNPVWFDFIEEYKNYGEGRQNGMIAQEVAEVIPEAVFVTPSTGKMGINYDQMHAVYIKAIQELKLEIEELSNKILALESK